MTRNELVKAFELRVDGLTWDEIGARLFFTGDHVKKSVRNALDGKGSFRVLKSAAYPQLAQYITARYRGNASSFAGAAKVSSNVILRALAGKSRLSGPSLEKIRRVAGNIV